MEAWLADLDEIARQSFGFFANRPIVLDLSGLPSSKEVAENILSALAARSIRVIAVEGIDPTLVPPTLAPLAGGMVSAKIIDFPGVSEARRRVRAAGLQPAAASMIIDKPVRSGQSIFFPDGDLTIIGAVSSGAEVIAGGGSVHIEGALRGRAMAGATGNAQARIFCRKFEAELVAINGNHLTAEQCEPGLIGRPVQVQLHEDVVTASILDSRQ